MNHNKERRASISEQYIGSPDPQGIHRNLKLDKAKALSYFHPDLTTMEEVRRALMPYIHNEGSFIIRMSITQQNMLTVSVIHQRTIKHFKIQQKCDQYYLQDKCFDCVEDLVEYYRNCDVPNMEQVKGVRLIHPIEYSGYTPLLPVGDHRRGSLSNFAASREDDSQPPPPQASTVLCGKDSTRSSASISTGRESRHKSQRPPIPLPEEPAQDKPSNGVYNGVYYSHVKQENFLPELMEQLTADSSNGETQCECGLDENVSQLPQGWSVHICHDQNTFYGCPFFMDSSNVTSWTLPDEVRLELNQNQKMLIKLLEDNFHETKQPPDKKKIQQWMSVLRKGAISSNY